jgi:hypothetical protein
MYGIISKDPKAPYYENIRFSYISPEKFLVLDHFRLREAQHLFLKIYALLQIIYRIELANFLGMDNIGIFHAYI